jgi:hypothetical protein
MGLIAPADGTDIDEIVHTSAVECRTVFEESQVGADTKVIGIDQIANTAT